jgi:CheY-like chemotaxis protein
MHDSALLNRCALVIEDDPHSLIAISNLLSELGIRYKRNTTGADVAAQALHMQPRPDFILLDVDLPLADPFHIVAMLQNHPELAHIPIIFISDRATLDLLDRARSYGCAGVLTKPLPRRQLGELFRRVLEGEAI